MRFLDGKCRRLRGGRILLLLSITTISAALSFAQTIRVDFNPAHVAKTFVPTEALGAGIDRINTAATDKLFAEPVMKQVLSAGWQTVTYRQNTELFVEAWHWNPKGTWSDPSGKGYFVGNPKPGDLVRHSFGYLLPHRGFTRNDGTDANGYSRITDGNEKTYWKSNPYLSRAFTGEDDSHYPQWIVVDLASNHDVNALRISWASLTRGDIWFSTGRVKTRSNSQPRAHGSRSREAKSGPGEAASRP